MNSDQHGPACNSIRCANRGRRNFNEPALAIRDLWTPPAAIVCSVYSPCSMNEWMIVQGAIFIRMQKFVQINVEKFVARNDPPMATVVVADDEIRLSRYGCSFEPLHLIKRLEFGLRCMGADSCVLLTFKTQFFGGGW